MSDAPAISYYQADDEASKVEQLTRESARRQFFKALYDRDYDLVKLLLTGSRRKYVNANLICLEDRWTALHACLYKYNQYPPDETLRIVELLLEHNSDVNKACPEGAVAINVLDKKPLPNGQQNGPDNPNREKKTVSFQNKMVLDVAIDFLQAYKWAGCRQTVLSNWKPLIELLDGASMKQSRERAQDHRVQFEKPKTMTVDSYYSNTFRIMYEQKLATDCTITVIPPKQLKNNRNNINSNTGNSNNNYNHKKNTSHSQSDAKTDSSYDNPATTTHNNNNSALGGSHNSHHSKPQHFRENSNDFEKNHNNIPKSPSYPTSDVKDDGNDDVYTTNTNNKVALESLDDDDNINHSGSLDSDSNNGSEHSNHNNNNNNTNNNTDSLKTYENNQNNNNNMQNNSEESKASEMMDDTKEKIFHCHKSVLMGASPVMRAIFSSHMEESRTSKITMEDMLPSSVECMLHYIYCGEILEYYFNKSNIFISLQVLCLSDKYDIKGLKEHCEYRLHIFDELLTPDTGLDILIAADRYNANRLRKVAMSYVTDNFNQISQSQTFGEFSQCNPKLVQELFTAVARELQKKSREINSSSNNNNNNNNKNVNSPNSVSSVNSMNHNFYNNNNNNGNNNYGNNNHNNNNNNNNNSHSPRNNNNYGHQHSSHGHGHSHSLSPHSHTHMNNNNNNGHYSTSNINDS